MISTSARTLRSPSSAPAQEIEEFHRGLKQTTGVAECSARRPSAQRAPIGAALLAFLTLERYRLRTGIVPRTEAKMRLTRSAIAELLGASDTPLFACVPRLRDAGQ